MLPTALIGPHLISQDLQALFDQPSPGFLMVLHYKSALVLGEILGSKCSALVLVWQCFISLLTNILMSIAGLIAVHYS